MKNSLIHLGLAAACTLPSCTKDNQSDNSLRPNIVVILADDLGFGDVSAYGSNTIHTPNIDKIANEGVRFTNGYASSATSTPSRAALLTGMYPWKNDKAQILDGDAPLIIDPNACTLPRIFQNSGYVTGAIGKWHLGMGNGNVDWNDLITPGANELGFDYSCLAAATNDRVPTVFVENGRVLNLDPNDPIYVDYEKNFDGEPSALDNPELVEMQWSHGHNNAVINGIPRIGFMKGGQSARWDDYSLADFYVSRVKDFIIENQQEPFFLYYGLHQPHVPRTPSHRFSGTSGMGPRGDAIIEADWCVGEVIHTLDSLNLLENTIVIFTSDNGPVLDDGYVDKAEELVGDHKPTGGLRGGKYSLFDGGSHIPFFVWQKGKTKNVTSNALVTQMDLLASLSSLIGADIPNNLDSKDLMDTFMGYNEKGRDELIFEASGRLGLRSGDWILIPPYAGPKTNATGNELGNMDDYGLYNVASDPFQEINVANDNPQLLKHLIDRFHAITGIYYKPEVSDLILK